MSPGEAHLVWETLKGWLARDESGQRIIAAFSDDPAEAAEALRRRLEADVPPTIQTLISGTAHVDQLINIAELEGGLHLHLPPTPLVPRQLPPDILPFTGRRSEIAALAENLTSSASEPTLAGIWGAPGVGKSSLAIHVAHLLTSHYSTAQLYVDLAASDEPFDAEKTIKSLLAGMSPNLESIPEGLAATQAAYRSFLSMGRTLLLIDNVSDLTQLAPLLPGTGDVGVIVTSRRPLPEFSGIGLLLDVFSEAEGLELLRAMVGVDRIDPEWEEAQRLVQLCGSLPLAIRIVGARLQSRKSWDLSEFRLRLEREDSRLSELESPGRSVRVVLDSSYSELSIGSASLLSVLASTALVEFSAELAAVALSEELDVVRDLVEELVEAQLLEELGQGRHRMHELVRIYAKDRLLDADRERVSSAEDNLLIELARSAFVAQRWLNFRGADEHHDARQQADLAARWFDAEIDNLLQLIRSGTSAGKWDMVARLGSSIVAYLESRGEIRLLADLAENVAMSARRAQEFAPASEVSQYRRMEAIALHGQAVAAKTRGNPEESLRLEKDTLRIYSELEWKPGIAQALGAMGVVHADLGALDDAESCHQQALTIYKEEGLRREEGRVRLDLAVVFIRRGGNARDSWEESNLIHQAIEQLRAALTIFEQFGDDRGRAGALLNLGVAFQGLTQFQKAAECMEAAASLFESNRNPLGQAMARVNLASTLIQLGKTREALESVEMALPVLQRAGDLDSTAKGHMVRGLAYLGVGSVHAFRAEFQKAISLYESVGSPEAAKLRSILADERFGA